MYERFTDRSRKVMQLAHREAHRFNHEYIGTEHILLGLIQEGSGVAANVLKNLDVEPRMVRNEIEKIIQHGPGGPEFFIGRLPNTPRAQKVIEYAIDEARRLKHNYVGTEHLLLGLLREEEGVAAQVLMNLGLKLEDVREEVLNLLGNNLPPATSELTEFRQVLTEATVAAQSRPPALTDEERQAIETRIKILQESKELFVAAQNFEDAVRVRSEVSALKSLLAWYDWFRRFP